MKKIQFLLALLVLSVVSFSCGQEKSGGTSVSLSTEIYCDHCEKCESCKERVEKALLATAGVNSANMKVAEKKIAVSYDPAKINEQQIKMAIAKTGFSAGDMAADPVAYDNLDDCCKKK
ncbi:MAG: heavy-metal-associated domain-containing protein [Saprospiraceae bacterium]